MKLTLTLRRDDLVARGACAEGLAIFDAVCTMRGDERAPLVRRGGVSQRDPSRLRIELSPLAQIWLARDMKGAIAWLRIHGLSPPVSTPRIDLTGAYLRGADLRGANLTGAILTGTNLTGADLTGADLTGADLTGASLRGTDLTGASLRGTDLTGARRWPDDPAIEGWALRDGVLVAADVP